MLLFFLFLFFTFSYSHLLISDAVNEKREEEEGKDNMYIPFMVGTGANEHGHAYEGSTCRGEPCTKVVVLNINHHSCRRELMTI